MTERQFKNYKKVQSFQEKCEDLKKYIQEIPNQVHRGTSEVGYMIEEVQAMKKELIEICDKNIKMATEMKEII